MRAKVFSLLLLLFSAALANVATDYQCDPSKCVAPNCRCASSNTPGGLDLATVPQFVWIAFDAPITQDNYKAILTVLGATKNPNGCAATGTVFASTQYSNFWLIERLSNSNGLEIGTAGMDRTTSKTSDYAAFSQQITGGRKAISSLSGIPKSSIKGNRAAGLLYNNNMFQVVKDNGFLYDCSIVEPIGQGFSPSVNQQIWPYTLDYGAGQVCWTGECPSKAYPGVWEIPMWGYNNQDGSAFYQDNMFDPVATYDQLLTMLKNQLTWRLQGNKAPMGLFLSEHWLSNSEYVRAAADFVTWAATNTNVWFPTGEQLIKWVQNPVAASAMKTDSRFACSSSCAKGSEVCDGCDNNNDGAVDEFLTKSCAYPGGFSFQLCGTCPAAYPTPASYGSKTADTSSSSSPSPSTSTPSTSTTTTDSNKDTTVDATDNTKSSVSSAGSIGFGALPLVLTMLLPAAYFYNRN
eukprot:GILJ01010594.1.p1 GENE.GILJ01010594.1~~GILJ01010594.1.p1  ORF type:complete len:463 (+),score=85.92 GILJ01010594.1:115-1503(+)